MRGRVHNKVLIVDESVKIKEITAFFDAFESRNS